MPSLPTSTVTVVRDDAADDRNILDAELFSAHRALALLKKKLGRERILELIAAEIEESDAFFRDAVAQSGDQQLTGSTVLHITGISAGQFGAWLGGSFGREDVMLAGHPEHYVITNDDRPHIVETMGDHVCSFYMDGWDAAETPEPGSRRSKLVLADGTVFGWVSTVFRDSENGFTATLSVGLPASCGQDDIDQHLEHFSVEFRNWIRNAAAETA